MNVYVGIDGGGTKTRTIALTEYGDVVLDMVSPGSNVNHQGWEATLAILAELFENIRSLAGAEHTIVTVCLGMAGIDREQERRQMGEWIAAQWPDARVRLENDALTALAAGSGQQEGIVLIGGTGSIALGVNAEGTNVRVGGWGYQIGDEGSGYDIGRKALQAVMKGHDGRLPAGRLTELILGHFGVEDATGLIPVVYAESFTRDRMAGVARLVFTAAAEGDTVSLSLLEGAADDLSELVRVLLGRMNFAGQRVPVVLTGGLFHAGSRLAELVRHRLQDRVDVLESERPPVAGAVRLAQRLTGQAASPEFLKGVATIA